MKLTMIGHACWRMDTGDVRLLFDPLLHDPNQCGVFEVHPTRQLHVQAAAEVDVVVVSHRHIDHFDVQSLCAVPRHAKVVCPPDAIIVEALRSIGFADIRTAQAWEELRFGSVTMIATPSTNPVPEFGFVVSNGESTVWNQVDTQLTADAADIVNKRYGRLDVVIAPWQPLLELRFQQHGSISFPHAAYADLLARAARCATRMVVPGACGFRHGPTSAWLNRLEFPVGRRRFADDIASALPANATVVVAMDPGDELVCVAANPFLRAQASSFASSARDEDHLIAFCPVDPFQDLFREGAAISVADARLSAIIDDLDAFARSSATSAYASWGVVYQLIVCCEHGNVFVSWDYRGGVQRKDDRTMRATATCIIAEQSLRGLAAGTCSWEQACHCGGWRHFQSVARVRGLEYFVPAENEIVDLLQLRFPYSTAFQHHVASELERWALGEGVSAQR